MIGQSMIGIDSHIIRIKTFIPKVSGQETGVFSSSEECLGLFSVTISKPSISVSVIRHTDLENIV